jgi:hypothetical protein
LLNHGKSPEKLVISRATLGTANLCKCAPITQMEREALALPLGVDPKPVLVFVTYIRHKNIASMVAQALAAALRGLGATKERYIVVWPHAPLTLIGEDVRDMFLMSFDHRDARIELADVILVLDAEAYENPALHACRSATVVSDLSPLSGEPSWEWGHGLVQTLPRLPAQAKILDYARSFELALQPDRNTRTTTYQHPSEAVGHRLNTAAVACTNTDLMYKVQNAPPRTLKPGNKRSVVSGIANEVSHAKASFDMRDIQEKLQFRKQRNGYGRHLQLKCPERIYRNTVWIDALESINGCGGESIDAELLRSFAEKQCGAWCVANVGQTYPKPYGWALQGACWSVVNSTEHVCSQHIKSVVRA